MRASKAEGLVKCYTSSKYSFSKLKLDSGVVISKYVACSPKHFSFLKNKQTSTKPTTQCLCLSTMGIDKVLLSIKKNREEEKFCHHNKEDFHSHLK